MSEKKIQWFGKDDVMFTCMKCFCAFRPENSRFDMNGSGRWAMDGLHGGFSGSITGIKVRLQCPGCGEMLKLCEFDNETSPGWYDEEGRSIKWPLKD